MYRGAALFRSCNISQKCSILEVSSERRQSILPKITIVVIIIIIIIIIITIVIVIIIIITTIMIMMITLKPFLELIVNRTAEQNHPVGRFFILNLESPPNSALLFFLSSKFFPWRQPLHQVCHFVLSAQFSAFKFASGDDDDDDDDEDDEDDDPWQQIL